MAPRNTRKRTYHFAPDPIAVDEQVTIEFRAGDDGLVSVRIRDPHDLVRQVLYGRGEIGEEIAVPALRP